jgi:hypothetical protein
MQSGMSWWIFTSTMMLGLRNKRLRGIKSGVGLLERKRHEGSSDSEGGIGGPQCTNVTYWKAGIGCYVRERTRRWSQPKEGRMQGRYSSSEKR